MTVLGLVGLGCVAVVALALLRPVRPELAVLLALVASVVLLALLLPRIAQIAGLLRQLAARGGVGNSSVAAVLRIIGVAYMAEFGAQVARDAGEGAVAAKVELGGKVLILTMALPIIMAVLQLMLRLLRA